ncbi:MAG TPA: hypothetical protein VN947_25425 [Polyangia bacterium]|nr:hypothetical protein [Polyangia bacterium]
MRNRLIPIAALCVIIAVGFYAWRSTRVARAVAPASKPAAAQAAAFVPKPYKRTRPQIYAGTPYDPQKKYAPGTYTPAGFAVDYRERVVHEFSHFMSTRLGKELDDERAKQVEAVQNKFWDSHGPDVDLLAQGKITQPEFAERSHQTMIAFASDMEKIFSDDEYQKIFDVPKGTDTFYVLAHSPTEQPGMKFQPEKSGSGPPNLSQIPQPHPTEASETDSPAPPSTSDKWPKSGK